MNTYVASCAHCMRMTAFLTSSSAAGMDLTGTETITLYSKRCHLMSADDLESLTYRCRILNYA